MGAPESRPQRSGLDRAARRPLRDERATTRERTDMYNTLVDRIKPVLELLDECRSKVESVELVLEGDIGKDMDESIIDVLAAPRISGKIASCREALAILKDGIEDATGSEAISYEGKKGFEQNFEHSSLSDILADAYDSLQELVSDFMCAEKDLVEAVSICTALEEHVAKLENGRSGPTLSEMAADEGVSFEDFVQGIETALQRPLYDLGIESSGTLAGRVEDASHEGDWNQ